MHGASLVPPEVPITLMDEILHQVTSVLGMTKRGLAQRVQVPNSHILASNLYHKHYYPKPKYIIIGYMDPLGRVWGLGTLSVARFSPSTIALKFTGHIGFMKWCKISTIILGGIQELLNIALQSR